MKPKIYSLITLIVFCSATLFAENLAVINNTDGFTIVRDGPGKDFKVVDTLYPDDFFFFRLTNGSDWAKVTVCKGKWAAGYIHTSRIQEVEKLNSKKQKALLIRTLDRQRILADNFYNALRSGDTTAFRTAAKELEFYTDTKYDPLLDVLPKYFCARNDTQVLQLFLTTIWADKGSADEMPSFSIGNCFMCNADLVIQQVSKIKTSEEKEFLFDCIEWGLLNHFGVDENHRSGNSGYRIYEAKLEHARKKRYPGCKKNPLTYGGDSI